MDLRQKDFRGVNLGGIDLSDGDLSLALFDHATVFPGIDPLTISGSESICPTPRAMEQF